MRLRKEIQDRLNITADIRAGWPAQFVVCVDDRVIFSRRKERRLPRPGEITQRLSAELNRRRG